VNGNQFLGQLSGQIIKTRTLEAHKGAAPKDQKPLKAGASATFLGLKPGSIQDSEFFENQPLLNFCRFVPIRGTVC